MTNEFDHLVPMPWYRRERYDDTRARMADGDTLPERFDDWLARIEEIERQMASRGKTMFRVNVDDDAFATFCAKNDLLLDKAARAAYCLAAVPKKRSDIENHDIQGLLPAWQRYLWRNG